MPHEKKEHKCSHHAASANSQSGNASWWHSFHFSGKVIMCSVLFGLGLILIGGLILAIGMDRNEEPIKDNLEDIQNKAPMSIVGPVIMGIGSFTVIVGIIMCLFETNICRKREPDSRPLIEEQGTSSTNFDANVMPSNSKKSERHRHHKRSSAARKHKSNKNKFESSGSISPSSRPIDMQRSSSRDFTASDKFLTPPSSFVPDNNTIQSNQNDTENQTSSSMIKSITSSGKSWNTSTEFKTPSSSFEDNSWSYETKNKERDAEDLSESSNSEDTEHLKVENLRHEFLTPQNSSAGILNIESKKDADSNKEQEPLRDKTQHLDNPDLKAQEELRHEFVTPVNSYVERNDFPLKATEVEVLNTASLKKDPVLEKTEITPLNTNVRDVEIPKNSAENNIKQKEYVTTRNIDESEKNNKNLSNESGLSDESPVISAHADESEDKPTFTYPKDEKPSSETSIKEDENLSFPQSNQILRKQSSNEHTEAMKQSVATSVTMPTDETVEKENKLDHSPTIL